MIELRAACRRFGIETAVHPLDFTVEAGKTTVLIGPSGCGKSTLLRLMIGLITPTSGDVRIDGTLVSPDTTQSLRRKMGYVIQEGGLFPHMTAGQNASLMARYLGWGDEKVQARLDTLAELTHLEPSLLNRFPAQLSGGQRQRVSLMRALFLDPSVLLMDEPLGALDPMIRAELQQDLSAIFESLQKTVVMVTHDMGEAAFFGHTLVLMRAGRIVQQGSAETLLAAPVDPFVTRFINAQRPPQILSREATT